jgi:hypothetical protein
VRLKSEVVISHSIKNKYFLSHACCQSEKKDKKIWHKAFRKKEKQKISNSDLGEHVTTHYREVSNPWNMGKDCKRYYPKPDLLTLIKGIAKRFYKNKKERIANERKIFYRWVGK